MHSIVRLVVTAAAALVVVAGPGTSASAGGWAVGSIDSIPEAAAGRTVDVGFTILQHGVTPVDLDDDVGVEIVLGDGTVQFFPATGAGETGRYIAAVTFPSAPGEYSWNLRMGWFGAQELGRLDVAPVSHGGWSGVWTWSTAGWTASALAAVLAAVAVACIPGLRRRAPATST